MQRNFYIFIQLPDGSRRVAGRMLYEPLADGFIQSYFRYEPDWLSHTQAFALDPVNLPLTDAVFQLKSRTGLWGVMEDGLPDAWGRRLIQARHMVDVSRDNNIALLLLTEWAEPGAIGFADTIKPPPYTISPMDMDMTNEAIDASEAFEKDAGAINLPDFFISGGSSAGGARPKVLARAGNKHYLLKFPSINDPSPEIMAHLEFFGMSCAKNTGIPVPVFFMVKGSGKRRALAVERFDTTDTGRLHFLSFQSLTGVEEQLGLPYTRLADIIRKVSGNPEEDLQNLYKQMIVNVLLTNGDDHLKNFSMLYNPSLQRFCLSPAYDIVPNLWQREHILAIGGKTTDITLADILREGGLFSFSKTLSRQLCTQTTKAVSQTYQTNQIMLNELAATQPICQDLIKTIHDNIDRLSKQLEARTP